MLRLADLVQFYRLLRIGPDALSSIGQERNLQFCMYNLQVFSFKLRGAYNKMASLSQEQRDIGVITSSAGNHAQGVALSAKTLVNKSACT